MSDAILGRALQCINANNSTPQDDDISSRQASLSGWVSMLRYVLIVFCWARFTTRLSSDHGERSASNANCYW